MFPLAVETPAFLDWLVVYWPILIGLLVILKLANETLRDVRELKRWFMHHRHDEDGKVFLPAEAFPKRAASGS